MENGTSHEHTEPVNQCSAHDENLIEKARAGNASALDTLMHRYKPLVKARAKDYFLVGGDLEDLIQEGMIGLYKAVLDFDPSKNAKFSTFASLCVTRQIQTAIKAANRQKHLPLNSSLSLQSDALAETQNIPDHRLVNPEDLLLRLEAYRNLDAFIQENLSQLEQDVLMHHVDGKTYMEIAGLLEKNAKTVDNALQRIKRKIGKGIANDLM